MSQLAEIIVDGILRDLKDRRGLRHEWEQIDDDIQDEIIEAWRNITQVVLEQTYRHTEGK